MKNQFEGIVSLVKNEVIVKVNTVLIPSVNDKHVVEIAKNLASLGVYIQNIIPLIPQYRFNNIPSPTAEEKRNVQKECNVFIRQMYHCRRCRSDAIGILGQDIQNEFLKNKIA